MATRKRLHDPKKVHNDFAQQVEWIDNGRTVVSTGADGLISLYDADRGLVRASLPGSPDLERGYTYLLSVARGAVSAITGAEPGRAYPLDPDKWLDYACVVVGRDLSRDEWRSYLPDRDYEKTCTGRR